MLMAVLEGRAPNRRTLRPTEVAASHLAAAAEEAFFSSQGGFGRIIIYVSFIATGSICTHRLNEVLDKQAPRV